MVWNRLKTLMAPVLLIVSTFLSVRCRLCSTRSWCFRNSRTRFIDGFKRNSFNTRSSRCTGKEPTPVTLIQDFNVHVMSRLMLIYLLFKFRLTVCHVQITLTVNEKRLHLRKLKRTLEKLRLTGM